MELLEARQDRVTNRHFLEQSESAYLALLFAAILKPLDRESGARV